MIYLDASAIVTFVVGRPNVDELRDFLDQKVRQTCTSTVGLVETVRTCERIGNYPRLMATLLLDHVEIPLTGQVRDAAANVPGAMKSLDAIHIASAELLGAELEALVTYDRRLAEIARRAGLPVEMPGVE